MEKVTLRSILRRCVAAHALSRPATSVEEGIRRPAGVYGAAPTSYLSTAARVQDFTVHLLEEALWSRRSVVRVPAMRGSVYLLPHDLIPSGLAIGAASSGAQWLRPALRRGGLADKTIERLIASIETLLRGGPKTAIEIRKGLGGWKDPFPQALSLLLRHLTYEGRLVSSRVRGGWRSQALEYALSREWVDLPDTLPSVERALGNLAPLYFEANGPATLANFAWWAGVGPEMARRVVEAMDLEPASVEGLDGVHLATPASLDAMGSLDGESSTHLVPFWDSYVMAQRDRRRYLDPKWATRVIDRSGNATNVILKDGHIAGIWDCMGDALRFAPFEPVRLEDVREGAEPIQGLLEFRTVERVRLPGPLSERGQNAFMSPLRPSSPS